MHDSWFVRDKCRKVYDSILLSSLEIAFHWNPFQLQLRLHKNQWMNKTKNEENDVVDKMRL